MSEGAPPFRAPIGTHDVLPDESAQWEGIIATFAYWANLYGFGLIVSPMFEDVGVFQRGIGTDSDVTTKEMYVFTDRGDRQLALRPEGTASVVRAFVQHRPTTPWRAWYVTPAFRYERPQAGRYRQHHQLGVEALGSDDAAIDVEVITLAWRFYAALGLTTTRLLLNSMGDQQCRPAYVALLRSYLEDNAASLCDEHATSWSSNPLRVLDCKKDSCVKVTTDAPRLVDHLCSDCRDHFEKVTSGLGALGVPYSLAPRLVRGFDYYNRTTFEFVCDVLESAQNAIGGGGRYDQLAQELGGDATSGIGFGSGIERLILAREKEAITDSLLRRPSPVFVVDTTGGDAARDIVEQLRSGGIAARRAYDDRSMKAQMKAADRSGARLAVLVGPKEVSDGVVTLRDLRDDSAERQHTVAREHLLDELRSRLAEATMS